jgi:hypothetical protein
MLSVAVLSTIDWSLPLDSVYRVGCGFNLSNP